MSEELMKEWFSIKDLLGLPSLPQSDRGMMKKAERENWKKRQRAGVKGKAFEYHLASLPIDTQNELRTRFAVSVVEQKPKKLPVVKAEVDLANLTNKQRAVADARMVLISKVLELEDSGMSRIQAVRFLCRLAKNGELPPEMAERVAMANAKKNEKRTIGERTLNQWVIDYCKAENAEQRLKASAPRVRQAVAVEEYFWAPWFLGVYRQSQGFSIQESYRYFQAEWRERFAENEVMLAQMPSISQVRRMLNKLPVHIRELGRLSGAKYKQLLPYVKRDWNSHFTINDIWIGDGHSLKMKVKHPVHGRPFTPELTMIVDGASRKVVGWSLSLVENAFAVLDALRMGIQTHGIPAIYYSDNGGGEKNKMLDAPVTGILPRFSIYHATGIAGNPQGRGIIERLNKTIGFRIAERFDTFYGSQADPENTRKMLSRQLSLANTKLGKALTVKQRKAKRELPEWDELMAEIKNVIDWYNNQVHREIQCKPAEKFDRLKAKTKQVWLSQVELQDIERPHFERITRRGLIEWNNHQYFHVDLLNHQGKKVVVCVDIYDASFVQVRTQEGRFICNAEFEGHRRDAFPVAFVEQKRKARMEGKIKRGQAKIDEAKMEFNPVRTIEQAPEFSLEPTVEAIKAKQATPIFLTQAEKEEWEEQQRAFG
ncbi:transposase [Haemophilus sputorum]|uniref:Transposase n=2 Tax=Haemophilus sputorum TaxID=1078480 RepID=A0A369YFP7_9PAST|nr:transposase [Haemophilus sputorum]